MFFFSPLRFFKYKIVAFIELAETRILIYKLLRFNNQLLRKSKKKQVSDSELFRKMSKLQKNFIIFSFLHQLKSKNFNFQLNHSKNLYENSNRTLSQGFLPIVT
jgi:hypothetical protein